MCICIYIYIFNDHIFIYIYIMISTRKKMLNAKKYIINYVYAYSRLICYTWSIHIKKKIIIIGSMNTNVWRIQFTDLFWKTIGHTRQGIVCVCIPLLIYLSRLLYYVRDNYLETSNHLILHFFLFKYIQKNTLIRT